MTKKSVLFKPTPPLALLAAAVLAPLASLVLLAPGVAAQEAVWLCGQTLTNRLPDEPAERRNCQSVQLPAGTTVHVAPASAAAPAAPASAAGAGAPRAGAAWVSSEEQKQRDAQARRVLQAELERVQDQWRQARAQGDAALSARTEADLAALQRELARLP